LKQALMAAIPPQGQLLGNLVAGKKVWDAIPAGGSNAVNPAWRKAYSHSSMDCLIPIASFRIFQAIANVLVVIPVSWAYNNATQKAAVTGYLTDVFMPPLRALAPNSGCYLNEVRRLLR
jgi:hypothetical protein